MSLWLVAYDIRLGSRRKSVAKIILEYGYRLQRSVFECRFEPKQIKPFRRRISPYLEKGDRFDILPIDDRGSRKRISWQRKPNPYPSVIVIHPRQQGDPVPPGCRLFSIDEIEDIPRDPPMLRHVTFLGMDGKPTKSFWAYPGNQKWGPVHHGTKDCDPHPPPWKPDELRKPGDPPPPPQYPQVPKPNIRALLGYDVPEYKPPEDPRPTSVTEETHWTELITPPEKPFVWPEPDNE